MREYVTIWLVIFGRYDWADASGADTCSPLLSGAQGVLTGRSDEEFVDRLRADFTGDAGAEIGTCTGAGLETTTGTFTAAGLETTRVDSGFAACAGKTFKISTTMIATKFSGKPNVQ